MSTILALPREMLLSCFFSLSYQELARCSCVCKLFWEVANDNSLWKLWCKEVWKWDVEVVKNVDFKELFVNLLHGKAESFLISLDGCDHCCLRSSVAKIVGRTQFELLDITDPREVNVIEEISLDQQFRNDDIVWIYEWRERLVVVQTEGVLIEEKSGSRQFTRHPLKNHPFEWSQLCGDRLCFVHEREINQTKYYQLDVMDLTRPQTFSEPLSLFFHVVGLQEPCSLYADDKNLYIGYTSGIVTIHEVETLAWKSYFQPHLTSITDLHAIGPRLLTASYQVQNLWDVQFRITRAATIKIDYCSALQVLGNRVFFSCAKGIEIYDDKALNKVAALPSRWRPSHSLHFIDSKVVRFVDGYLEVFDFALRTQAEPMQLSSE
jgi:F-box associated protein